MPLELAEATDAAEFLPRLFTDVQAALARIEITQLQASPGSWMVEIPVRHTGGADVLQVSLKQHREADDVNDWTLGFALDLPALGPVTGELHLRGLRLSVRTWAQRSDTTERLEAQFFSLRERLSASGLQLDQLSCQTGLPQTGNSMSAVFLKATV